MFERNDDERWVFDVDGCLIDSLTGTSLRPGALRLLTHLHAEGTTVVWWSAGGRDYACRRAGELGVDHLVDAFHGKDARDDAGCYLTGHVVGSGRVTFVDDRPEDLPVGAVVEAVSPYIARNPHDVGLSAAMRRAGLTPDGKMEQPRARGAAPAGSSAQVGQHGVEMATHAEAGEVGIT